MKTHIDCDVQVFVTEHKTEIDPNTGNPLKGYYVTTNISQSWVAGSGNMMHHKFKDLKDLVSGFNDLDLQGNYWGRAGQGDFEQGATSIPSNETIKHYIGFRAIDENSRYYGTINRTFVYLQTKHQNEPELLIFDKGIGMDRFLNQIEDIH